MVLHGMTDDIGYFMKSAIIFLLEGIEDSTLDRFETIDLHPIERDDLCISIISHACV